VWSTGRRKRDEIPVTGDQRSSVCGREGKLLLISDGARYSAYFSSGERIDPASSELLGYDGRKMLVEVVA
jgi:hypothetical protein